MIPGEITASSRIIRIDYDTSIEGNRDLAEKLASALRNKDLGVNLVSDRNTGPPRQNTLRYTDEAEAKIGKILQIVVRNGGGRLFDEVEVWAGPDVGATEADVLISLRRATK